MLCSQHLKNSSRIFFLNIIVKHWRSFSNVLKYDRISPLRTLANNPSPLERSDSMIIGYVSNIDVISMYQTNPTNKLGFFKKLLHYKACLYWDNPGNSRHVVIPDSFSSLNDYLINIYLITVVVAYCFYINWRFIVKIK